MFQRRLRRPSSLPCSIRAVRRSCRSRRMIGRDRQLLRRSATSRRNLRRIRRRSSGSARRSAPPRDLSSLSDPKSIAAAASRRWSLWPSRRARPFGQVRCRAVRAFRNCIRGSPAAPGGLARALRGADLIVVVGAPVFTFHVEGQCELLDDGTSVWQITDDPTEAASASVGDTIISTLPKALAGLLSAMPDIAEREVPAARLRTAAPAAQNPIPPGYALARLSALMPGDAIVVEEAPSHRPAIQQFLPRPGADSFYTMASGGLGYSLPASVGVALARPGRRIVALIGDGSAMYCIQAIWTAVQRRLPITFVIMNNSGYGAMRAFSQLMQAHRPPGIDLPGLDFVALARGMGCPGQRVTDAGDVDAILTEALASSGPALVDIAVDDATTDLFSHPR